MENSTRWKEHQAQHTRDSTPGTAHEARADDLIAQGLVQRRVDAVARVHEHASIQVRAHALTGPAGLLGLQGAAARHAALDLAAGGDAGGGRLRGGLGRIGDDWRC